MFPQNLEVEFDYLHEQMVGYCLVVLRPFEKVVDLRLKASIVNVPSRRSRHNRSPEQGLARLLLGSSAAASSVPDSGTLTGEYPAPTMLRPRRSSPRRLQFSGGRRQMLLLLP